MKDKSEALSEFSKLYKILTVSKNQPVASIRSDHGREFDQLEFDLFCDKHGISHNFSAPRTPQQNGVVERKNRTLEDISRTMLLENNLPKSFWGEAVNTANYILNRCLIRPILKKTLMNFLKAENLLLHTLNLLVALASFTTMAKITLESLMPEVMKEFLLVTLLLVRHIEFTIRELRL